MGSLFSSAEDDAPPAAWRLGGEREAIARRLGREEGGAVRWACRVDAVERVGRPRCGGSRRRERARACWRSRSRRTRSGPSLARFSGPVRPGRPGRRLRGRHADGAGQACAVARRVRLANFNFSVSHDSDFVLVASERSLVGGRGGRARCGRFQIAGPPAAFAAGEWARFLGAWTSTRFGALGVQRRPRPGPGASIQPGGVGCARGGRGPFASAHVVLDGRVDRWRVDVAFWMSGMRRSAAGRPATASCRSSPRRGPVATGGPRGGAFWMRRGRPLSLWVCDLNRLSYTASPNDADDDFCERSDCESLRASRVWRRTKSA